MLTESHKFVTAYFIDNNRKIIEVQWQDPDSNDGLIGEHILFNEEDDSYKHLLKFTTLENIHAKTKERIKEQRETYLATVKYIAEQENLIYAGDSESIFAKLNDFLFNPEKNQNTEFLFKIKLTAFELPFVKECENREMKSELRKASSILEIYKILIDIKLLVDKDVSTGSENSESN